MTQIPADVLRGFQAAGIEAVDIDLKATVVAVALVDGALQGRVSGPCPTQLPDQQIAPLGRQPAAGDGVDFHPGVSQAVFCQDEVHVRFEPEITPEGVHDFEPPHAPLGIEIEIAQHFAHRPDRGREQDFQE